MDPESPPFAPEKGWLRVEVRLEESEETQQQLEKAGLDVMNYDSEWGRYRIRLYKGDVTKYKDVLVDLTRRSYEAAK